MKFSERVFSLLDARVIDSSYCRVSVVQPIVVRGEVRAMSAGNKGRAEGLDLAVGQRLRIIRSMRGLSQADLARILDVSHQQIQKYEAGANRMPVTHLARLAFALEVYPGYFFCESDLMTEGNFSPEEIAIEAKLLQNFRQISDARTQEALADLVERMASSVREEVLEHQAQT